MKRIPCLLLTLAGTIAGGTLLAIFAGQMLWKRGTEQANLQIQVASTMASTTPSFSDLPAPVQRYFQFALPEGQISAKQVRIQQSGQFRMGGFNAPWRPFTAAQVFSSMPPAFIWDATIEMMPLLQVNVRDSYIDGHGGIRAKVLALVPVVNLHGQPELSAGALQRYLAESAWFPTALLPSPNLSWEAIDEHSARATLVDKETTVSLDFVFGENGEILRTYTPGRYREVNGRFIPTPWTGYYKRYRKRNNMMVPTEAEVAWILPEGELAYARIRVEEITLEH